MTLQALPKKVIAIDWSGAESKSAQRRGICAAVCGVGGPEAAPGVELIQGRLRSEVEAWLISLAAAPGSRRSQALKPLGRENQVVQMVTPAPVVVGLDFSFSLPAWFLRELGCASAPELWRMADEQGERWLREPHSHFWGRRKGSGPPAEHRAPLWRGYRACERTVLGGGPRNRPRNGLGSGPAGGLENETPGRRLPLSSFQIGGAGAVGTGTLRGLPMLARLRAAGWSVWPFDLPSLPMLIEIYPRSLTGPVVKSSAAARVAYLMQARFAELALDVRKQAEASEDAFDALVSALAMREHAAEFGRLQQALNESARLEGAIWRPGLV